MMKLKNVKKTYQKDNELVEIFDDLSISFEKGKFYIITGESGAGKSTLINMLALLEEFDKGEYSIDGEELTNLNDFRESEIRFKKIGIIFQDYFLNERLTAYENVLIASLLDDTKTKAERENEINKLFENFRIIDRKKHYPKELSGGEQQRVCVARALVNNPSYILADEPTGSLDEKNTKIIMDILKGLVSKDRCVIMTTHDKSLIKCADVHLHISNHDIKKVN